MVLTVPSSLTKARQIWLVQIRLEVPVKQAQQDKPTDVLLQTTVFLRNGPDNR